jgi:methylated-DNA-[protein]-cysteine S-methyltransferase
MHYDLCPSPLGDILLVANAQGLTGLHFVDQKYLPQKTADWEHDAGLPVLITARRQLAEYFAGERRAFDLSLAPVGTAFQQTVWMKLREIPYGATTSYGVIAQRLGQPTASRAVGAANGRNPIGIIVPCHRVLGSSGTLTGYAGGLHRKQALLALENAEFKLM